MLSIQIFMGSGDKKRILGTFPLMGTTAGKPQIINTLNGFKITIEGAEDNNVKN
jgi:hypothetical protein